MVSANESHPTTGPAPVTDHRDPAYFYKKRRRIYDGLLLFIVIVGLPIVAVPYLRNRLSERVMALKVAVSGDIKPALAQVGANREPFPQEFERPEPVIPQPPKLPPLERVFTMKLGGEVTSRPIPRTRPAPQLGRLEVAPPPPAQGEGSTEQAAASAPAASSDSEPKYQQGKAEQDAYNLLLKSNATVAGMVKGSNPSLRFKSWDAANRGEDTYWVRLKFQSDGDSDVEYIWVVKPQANQVTPLNYNARSLS